MNDLIPNFKPYMGNPNLKRSGVDVNWTPDLVQEWIKCSNDVVYFVKNYMKIVHVDRGLIHFEPYTYQNEMLQAMSQERYCIFATSRQAGKCVIGDTQISLKFLDSKSDNFSIKFVHEIFNLLNKYRSLYIYGENYDTLGKQIYQDLLFLDRKEANKFFRIWRNTSYNSRKSWWKEYTNQSSNAFFERTLYSTFTSSQDVSSKHNRISENVNSGLDDVSYKEESENKFSDLCKNERTIYKNVIGNDEGSQESILWKDLERGKTSSERIFGEEKNTRSKRSNCKFYEIALGKRRESRKTNTEYKKFGKSEGSQYSENWHEANRRIKSKKKRYIKETLSNGRTSLEGETFNGRTKNKIKSFVERKTKVGRNKNENEVGLGTSKKEKFIESFEFRGFYVKSDTGWKPLYQSHKTIPFDLWSLKTKTKTLICADKHIVFDKNFEEVFVENLQVGDLIQTDNGLEEVVELYNSFKKEHMYDLGVDSNEHRYYTNGILSHNSTVTCAFILWYIIFNESKNVGLLANKGETAREILGKIQLAYQHLPKWMQQGVLEWNKGSFVLENGSRVIATATSSNNIRGFSLNLVFIDEAAFIDNWEEFFTSVYPTISSGKTTQVILVSTPNGLNHFYAIWQNALEGRNNYKPIMVKWNEVPGRDDNWRRDALAALNFDQEKFDQEYEVEFQGSSGTLISGWKLKQMVHKNPIHEKDGLYQFVPPVENHSYVCLADVSRGKGLDYSAFHIIDVTTMPYTQVCTYRNNFITPMDYAEVIFRACRSYNRAMILVEINDIGEQVATSIHHDYEYENMLFTEHAGRAGKKITTGFGNGQQLERGIRTTKSVKSVGCSILKLLIEQDQLLINDYYTINELSTFSKKGASFEAEAGKHDDLVMGLVLFAWLSDQMYFKEYTSINTLAKLREKTDEELTQELLPFGFVDGGYFEEEIIDQTEFKNWMFPPEEEFL